MNKIRKVYGAVGSTPDPENGTIPDLTTVQRLADPARIAVTAFSGLHGFIFAGRVVPIPAIQQRTDASADASASPAEGIALAGALGRCGGDHDAHRAAVYHRFGNHPMTVSWVCCSHSVSPFPRRPVPHSTWGVLLVFGIGFGWLNVGVNSAAVDPGAALRHP